MPDNLHKTLQPYIIRFKNGFAEHEKDNSINGKNGLEVREYLKAKVQDYFSEEGWEAFREELAGVIQEMVDQAVDYSPEEMCEGTMPALS